MRRLVSGVAAGLLSLASVTLVAAQSAGEGPASAPSPYVEQQATLVRGLSADEIHAVRNGEGMGLARPAELNGYPGPRHVLDLADALALTAEQRAAIATLFAQMQAEAITVGDRYLAGYAALEQAFRAGDVTPAVLGARVAALGRLEGELRAVHLKAHLATRALLTPEQVAAYTRLRGYEGPTPETTPAAPPAPHAPGHGH
jgi:Spy/CpxP family protein refolding chaperone